jgi:hypothetical protein
MPKAEVIYSFMHSNIYFTELFIIFTYFNKIFFSSFINPNFYLKFIIFCFKLLINFSLSLNNFEFSFVFWLSIDSTFSFSFTKYSNSSYIFLFLSNILLFSYSKTAFYCYKNVIYSFIFVPELLFASYSFYIKDLFV